MELPRENVSLEHVTLIVVAYVRNNTIQTEHLPALIADTFAALARLGQPKAALEELKPAVPIKRSVEPDHIVCLEDGRRFKTLKRYLMTRYGMTPDEYRQKWGLPADYPMVAPNYAAVRSEMAKQAGLGQRDEPAKRRAPKARKNLR